MLILLVNLRVYTDKIELLRDYSYKVNIYF